MSRKVINDLRLVKFGSPTQPDLESSLRNLLAGMEWQHESQFVSHLEANASWSSFEELSTIAELRDEVGSEFEDDLVSFLATTGEERADAAGRLIGFLSAVEGRALQHYEDASQPQMS
jgi:hypothetical protein